MGSKGKVDEGWGRERELGREGCGRWREGGEKREEGRVWEGEKGEGGKAEY